MCQTTNSPPRITTQGASFVATFFIHPKLLATISESVRIFLRLHDQYSQEITASAAQCSANGSITTKGIRPVSLKYCVDPEYIESSIALDLVPSVISYEDLTDLEPG